MATRRPSTRPAVGLLLRDWRKRRRLSQLDLALEAEVSARHLSFVESGRSRPSRELVLQLATQLEVPLRDQNALLMAAGFAPAYGEAPLEGGEMTPVRQALERVLDGHEPYPALAVDGHWNLVSVNRPASALLTAGVAPELLAPPANALRIALHPNGLAPRILNFGGWSEHLISRLHRQASASGSPALAELERELQALPGVRSEDPSAVDAVPHLFVPLVMAAPDGGELRFISTVTTFGTALDISVAELTIESFFPADDTTRAALQGLSVR